MNTDILFADNLDDMISGSFDRYCTHALCREGEASFLMTGEWFRMRKGDCVIFTHNELISKIDKRRFSGNGTLYLEQFFIQEYPSK